MFYTILISTSVITGLSIIFGLILSLFSKYFGVETNKLQEDISKILPGINCGACGFSGCDGYAEFLVKEVSRFVNSNINQSKDNKNYSKDRDTITCETCDDDTCPISPSIKEIDISLCAPGGKETAEALGKLFGIETDNINEKKARVRCRGTLLNLYNYSGIQSCVYATLNRGGQKLCAYGCVGFGDCVKACPFDAIHMGKDNIPIVDDNRCTGCGKCVKACPKNIIELFNEVSVVVRCRNLDPGKYVRKECKNGCIACGICERNCPEDAIHVKNFLAEIDQSKCTQCQICVEKCPTKCIVFTEGRILINKTA